MFNSIQERDRMLRERQDELSNKMFNLPFECLDEHCKAEVNIQLKNYTKIMETK